jgi:hypothetical protein
MGRVGRENMSNRDVSATYKGRSRRIKVEPLRAPRKDMPAPKKDSEREPKVSRPREKSQP